MLAGCARYGKAPTATQHESDRGEHEPPELNWERREGTHQIGFHDQRGKAANKPTLNKRDANATPLAFRDELIRLAVFSAT